MSRRERENYIRKLRKEAKAMNTCARIFRAAGAMDLALQCLDKSQSLQGRALRQAMIAMNTIPARFIGPRPASTLENFAMQQRARAEVPQ